MSKLAIRVWSAEVTRLEALLERATSTINAAFITADLDEARQALAVEGGLKHVRTTGAPPPAAVATVAAEVAEARIRLGFAELAESATKSLAKRVIEALAEVVEPMSTIVCEAAAVEMAEATAAQLVEARQQLALSRTALEVIHEAAASDPEVATTAGETAPQGEPA
jgi:hypothetical protein